MRPVFFSIALFLATALHAQPQYSIDWHKIAGGGSTSTSTNSQYSLSGTIGQHDAGSPMTGGTYSLTGGFWALYAVQTPGAPTLAIAPAAPGQATISWTPNTPGFVLQEKNGHDHPVRAGGRDALMEFVALAHEQWRGAYYQL